MPMELEFMFDGMEVGYFEEVAYPSKDGQYHYQPYRGSGHYEMATALRAGQMPECYYETESERVSFTVVAEDAVISPVIRQVIQLANFRRVRI